MPDILALQWDDADGIRLGSVNYNFLFAQPAQSALPSGAAETRASTAWYFDPTGTLQIAATDIARINYDPASGLTQGFLNEPTATNSIRNGVAAGAVAASPGTPPTNWSATDPVANGVTRTIAATTSESGIAAFDVAFSGTPSGSGTVTITFETTTGVVAAQNDVWTSSFFIKIVSGSLANLTNIRNVITARSATGTSLNSYSVVIAPTVAALNSQKFNNVQTIPDATTGRITNSFSFSYTSGLAVDVRFLIGLPQLVLASSPSSPIVTTGATVTRAADVLTLTVVAGTYGIHISRLNSTTRSSGVDGSGGSYVVPTSVSPLRYVRAAK